MTADPDDPQVDIPERVPSVIAEYVNSGGDTGATVRLNRRAWQRWSLVPRVLTDLSSVEPATRILGRSVGLPVLVAPMSGLSWLWPDGETECARGAADAGVMTVLTSGSACAVEDVGAAAPDGFLQQVYLWPDRERTWEFLLRAKAAGARGCVLTVDSPPYGDTYGFRGRVRDQLTPVVSPHFPDGRPPSGSPVDLTPDDIGRLADAVGLPVLVKGVLHPDDARTVVDAGAAGVIVSNHGGRQSDGTLTTAEALPAVTQAVDGRIPVWVDGGVRTAEDVVRALALGAEAVLLGRPVAAALARAGAAGVRDVLEHLHSGVIAQLAVCGARTPAELTRGHVRWRSWG